MAVIPISSSIFDLPSFDVCQTFWQNSHGIHTADFIDDVGAQLKGGVSGKSTHFLKMVGQTAGRKIDQHIAASAPTLGLK